MAALNLLRLSRMTGDTGLAQKLDQIMGAFSGQVKNIPMAHPQFLIAVDFMVGPGREIVIAGDLALETTRAMAKAIQQKFLPNKVLLLRPDEGSVADKCIALAPFLAGMRSQNRKPTVYICEQYACKAPVTTLEGLETALD